MVLPENGMMAITGFKNPFYHYYKYSDHFMPFCTSGGYKTKNHGIFLFQANCIFTKNGKRGK